jgi:type II secretory pathway pseudopilin PulG
MINYNQDIAPLRQQYFPMLMGERGFDQAMKYRQEVIMPMQMQTMKMQQQAMSLQQQELAYKQQKFQLRRARKTARRENEALEKIPEVIESISNISNDPSKDNFAQQRDLAQLQLKYASVSQFSPLVTNLFNSATRSIDNQSKMRERNDGKIYQAAVSGVSPEKIAQLANLDGYVSPSDEIAMEIARASKEKGFAKTQKELSDFQFEQQKEYLKAQQSEAESILKNVIDMSPAEVASDLTAGGTLSAAGIEAMNSADKISSQELTFGGRERAQLETSYLQLLPPQDRMRIESSDSLDRANFPDKDLYRAVLRRASSMANPVLASRSTEQKPSLSSKFIPDSAR